MPQSSCGSVKGVGHGETDGVRVGVGVLDDSNVAVTVEDVDGLTVSLAEAVAVVVTFIVTVRVLVPETEALDVDDADSVGDADLVAVSLRLVDADGVTDGIGTPGIGKTRAENVPSPS